jgi:hypothetical protein
MTATFDMPMVSILRQLTSKQWAVTWIEDLLIVVNARQNVKNTVTDVMVIWLIRTILAAVGSRDFKTVPITHRVT